MATTESQTNEEFTKSLSLLKQRNKALQNIVDVEKDIVVKQKEIQTAAGQVKEQFAGIGSSIVGGAEAFTTGLFGGPIGGLINTLTIGMLKRKFANKKADKEKAKEQEKRTEEETKLHEAGITKTAEILKSTDKYKRMRIEDIEDLVRRREVQAETAKLEEEIKNEQAAALDFIKKNDPKNKKAEDDGGEVVPDVKVAKDNGGEVVPDVKVAKDNGDDINDAIVESGGDVSKKLELTNEYLKVIADGVPTAEELEEAKKRGAASAGGEVAPPKEEDGGFTFTGLIGTVLGAISGAIMGTVAGLSIGFLNMWKNIFKFIGGKLAKMFPNVTKMLSNIFGKGGKLSKFFLAIKAFFTENKAFKTISDGFTKFKTSIKSFGTSVMKFINPILKLFGGGTGGGALKGFGKFGTTFKKFFGVFKGFFSKIFLPLQVIISLFDGFFEAKDAAGKSEGMLATFFNSIIGFFGGILDGFVMGTLDLIKDGISWIAGFLGFEDVEKFLDSFSFSDMFNEFLDDIYKWFNLLFSDPVKALSNLFSKYFGAVLSVGDFIVDMLKKPIIWIMKLFGWDDAAATTESFSLSGTVMAAWDKAVAWVKGLFAWGKKAGTTEEGGWSLLTFVDGVWTKVKEWFTGIFSWASTEKEGDSWVVKTAKNVLKGVKEWFGSMFEFDSASGLLKSVLNIMMWIPNLFVKAVAGITSYFAGLLGFDEASKDIANAGKEFSFGDLIMDGLKSLGDWLKGLFDIDVDAIGKSILGDTLYNTIFGGAKREKAELKKMGIVTDEGGTADDMEIDLKKLQEQMKTMSTNQLKGLASTLTKVQANVGAGADIEEFDDIMKAVRAQTEITGLKEAEAAKLTNGAVEKVPTGAKLISGGAIAAEGLGYLHKGEEVLEAAEISRIERALAGQTLNAQMMERQGAGGEAAGMGSAPIIMDNSTVVQNNHQSTFTNPIGQMLPNEASNFVSKMAA